MRNDPCVKVVNMVTCFPLGFSSKEQKKNICLREFWVWIKAKDPEKTWWKAPISGHLQENEQILFSSGVQWLDGVPISFVEHIPNICWYISSMFNTYSTSISYWLFICVDGRLTSPPSCCSISGKIVHIETQKIGNQLSLFQQVSLKPTSSIFCWSSLSLSLSQVKDPCETSSPSSTLHRVFPFFLFNQDFSPFLLGFPLFFV